MQQSLQSSIYIASVSQVREAAQTLEADSLGLPTTAVVTFVFVVGALAEVVPGLLSIGTASCHFLQTLKQLFPTTSQPAHSQPALSSNDPNLLQFKQTVTRLESASGYGAGPEEGSCTLCHTLSILSMLQGTFLHENALAL